MIPQTNPHQPVAQFPSTSTQGTAAAYGPAPSALPTLTNLSPDDLLSYCSAQLNAIDGQIHDFMGSQQRALQERQQVGKALSYLKQFGDKGPSGDNDWGGCYKALDDAIQSLPPGDPARAKLVDFENQLKGKYGTPGDPNHPSGGAPGTGEWAGQTSSLSQIGDDIKGQAELDMISLQGLVTQRQSVVSLTTQMMQKMQESLMSITKNI